MSAGRVQPLRYYRWALQQVKRLPIAEQDYYRQYARSQFTGHGDEIYEERIEEVAEFGLESAKWVLAKYELEPELPAGTVPWRAGQ